MSACHCLELVSNVPKYHLYTKPIDLSTVGVGQNGGSFLSPPAPPDHFFHFFFAPLFLKMEMCPKSYGALSSLCTLEFTLVLTREI